MTNRKNPHLLPALQPIGDIMSYVKSGSRNWRVSEWAETTYPDKHTQIRDLSQSVSTYWYKAGSAVPYYQSRIANGQDASSQYIRRDTRILQSVPLKMSGRVTDINSKAVTSVVWSYNWYNRGHPDYSIPAGDFTQVDQKALQSFYGNLRDEMESFQAIPFVKEFAQAKKLLGQTTLRLFNHFFERGGQLGSYARKLKRQKRPWRLASQDISKRWIEYQFGLAPLVSDANSLADTLRNRPTYSHMVVRGSASDMVSCTTSSDLITAPIICSARVLGMKRTFVTSRYVVGYNIVPSLSSRLGLSLTSIPGAVWEITPWSFLVDYFIDVSGFLASLTYAGLPFCYGTLSHDTKRLGLFSTNPIFPGPGATEVNLLQGGRIEWESRYYVRSPLSSSPSYLPSLRIADAFKGFHGLNIAALLGMRIEPW